MKTWLVLGASILGAYVIYQNWFDGEEPEADEAPQIAPAKPSGEASAASTEPEGRAESWPSVVP